MDRYQLVVRFDYTINIPKVKRVALRVTTKPEIQHPVCNESFVSFLTKKTQILTVFRNLSNGCKQNRRNPRHTNSFLAKENIFEMREENEEAE